MKYEWFIFAEEDISYSLSSNIKVRSYIARYPVLGTVQSALHFTPWQTCSFERQLDFSGKHSATRQLLREDDSFTYPPLSTARHSILQLSELEQRGVNEIAQFSKRQQDDSDPDSLYWESAVPTTHVRSEYFPGGRALKSSGTN